eukprot:4752848-Prymnesium_polylepis.1
MLLRLHKSREGRVFQATAVAASGVGVVRLEDGCGLGGAASAACDDRDLRTTGGARVWRVACDV